MEEKILLADDHGVVRVGLSMIIKNVRPQASIDEVDNYRSVREAIVQKKYDLIILDINMPNGTFQQTMAIIKVKQPGTKILVFSSQDERLYALRYLKMGADGFLHKLADQQTISRALQHMLDKGQFVSEAVKDAMIFGVLNRQTPKQNPLEVLTDRELTIAKELIRGYTNTEIGQKLNLHASTVSTYKYRLMQKLDAQSVPDLIHVFQFYDLSS